MNVHELETVRDVLEDMVALFPPNDEALMDIDVDNAINLLNEEIENAAEEEGAAPAVETDGATESEEPVVA